MLQKGTLYTYENDKELNVRKKPLRRVYFYFSQDGDRKLSMRTNESGQFEFDLPVGKYQVGMSSGANAQVFPLAGGSPFILSAGSTVDSFEKWILAPMHLRPEDNPLVSRLQELADSINVSASDAIIDVENASAQAKSDITKTAEDVSAGIVVNIERAESAANRAESSEKSAKAEADRAQEIADSIGAQTETSLERIITERDSSIQLIIDEKTAAQSDITRTTQESKFEITNTVEQAQSDLAAEREAVDRSIANAGQAKLDLNESAERVTTESIDKIENARDSSIVKIEAMGGVQVHQELGDSEKDTISQKAITDEFTKIGDDMNNIRFDYVKNYVDEKIKEGRIEQRLIKKDLSSPCFIKKNANTVAIKAGAAIVLKSGEIARYDNDEVVKLEGSHVPGSDYAIYADRTGALHAVADNFESPAIIPGDAVLIGGYHYGLIPENETVASGEFATTGAGMIWTQADVDRIRGINEFSLWDIRFRAGGIITSPLSPRFGQLSNHSMAFDRATNRWYALFHVGSEVDKYGVSRAGTDIASGTVLPVIPSAFNGNGVKKYENLNWWTANELVASQGARLLYEFEFNSRAFGTTENKFAGGSGVTYPKTERIKGLTSKIGCEQVVGVQYYWGLESNYRSDDGSWEWQDVTGGRGNYYTQGPYAVVKSLFGGYRTRPPESVGSRCVSWYYYPWRSYWFVGAVATRDLLIL
ncbi:hypothetical protein HX037_06315 [Ignatzschineria indica]|uniref:phage major tropism determinant n=1 Tax=Ignatzschineria indica TaxID=472583 RepID=UPI0025762E55|nr:hypothetical protein [Ignatzschineria indica]MDM1545498.1 hypothetical protein [Ignatzschineria indica]